MRKPNKAIAAITTLAIAASMAAPAFAATITASTGTDTHDITARYARSDTVYSVDISYESMLFTYTEGAWNTTTLKYAPGSWDGPKAVTVTNSSNAAINATVTADIDKGIPGSSGITADVDQTDAVLIPSAADTDPTKAGAAQDEDFNVTLAGAPTVRNWSSMAIGTVTVTIAAV